jgi:hypothetical protein
MRGVDFVFAVGADGQHVPHVALGGEVLEQAEAGRIDPLHVVEEQEQRMFGGRAHADEFAENRLEPVARFGGAQADHRRLRADHPFQFGDQVDQHLAVASDRVEDGAAPIGDLGFALGQDLPDHVAERLRQRGERNVALVLVVLAGDEQRAARHDFLHQFVHQHRFANAGITRHHHHLRIAALHDALEGGGQHRALAFAAVQLFRNQQARRDVVVGQRERIDAAVALPHVAAAQQVGFQPGRGLVALFRVLGQQLHDDHRQMHRDRVDACARGLGLARDVAVNPFQRFARDERQRAGQHAVEHDAERIQVAARIDRAVHAAGLFRRHVGEGAGDDIDAGRGLVFAQVARSVAEAGQVRARGLVVDQDIARLDVLVDYAAFMHLPHGRRDQDGAIEKMRHRHRPPEHGFQRRAAGIGQHQLRLAAFARQGDRQCGPGAVEAGAQGVLVRQPAEYGGRRMVGNGGSDQDRIARDRIDAAAQGDFAVLEQQVACGCRLNSWPGHPRRSFFLWIAGGAAAACARMGASCWFVKTIIRQSS